MLNSTFQAILDLSKLHMYRFHYLVMKPLFENKLEVCFMDTDSFLYQIYLPDIKSKLMEISEWLDFSNYEKTHPLYSQENMNKPGR